MNLYIVERTDTLDFEECQSIICVAENPHFALKQWSFHPNVKSALKCRKIGNTAIYNERKVLMVSWTPSDSDGLSMDYEKKKRKLARAMSVLRDIKGTLDRVEKDL